MKQKTSRTAWLGMVLLFALPVFSQTKAPQLGKDPVDEVIKAMTTEEKIKLVVGKGFNMPGLSMGGGDTTKDRIPTISGHTSPIPRLGIPSIGMADGPAGIHRFVMSKQDSLDNLFSTAWPVGTLLASSWDTALIKRVGTAFGEEIRDYGIDFILGPGVNVHRNPLGGRNFEYYSEDPLVSGKMAAAIINGIQSQGVGATIKHYAANNQETDRNTVDEFISERALREIYLKNFQVAIQNSQPWAVMSSYNLINGTYTSQSYDLLTTILRKEWGYKGFVMSDWFGGKDAVAQEKAGNDLLMPGTAAQRKVLMEAMADGQLTGAVLDQNVKRILEAILKTDTFKNYPYSNHPDLKEHARIAREAAVESMVLLKNENNTLPLTDVTKSIALFGNHAYDLIAGGTGSGDVNKAYAVQFAQGLTNGGYRLDSGIQSIYTGYLKDYSAKHPKKNAIMELMNPTPFALEYVFDKAAITKQADISDVAIVYIGRNAGEGKDRQVAGDYQLTDTEQAMIANVSEAFHAKQKPVIVVMNIGGVIEVASWRDKVDAILLAWQPGEEGGNAITDVLSGKVNPSGKLATTFPMTYNDVPSAKNFPGKEFPDQAVSGMFGQKSIPAEVSYEEGIYVGYRYYSTFGVKPAYPFGFGLSYGTFTYGNLKLSSSTFNNSITATMTITNQGKYPGKEAVQIYISAPASAIGKPSEELKAFAKTKLLRPHETQTLTFTFLAKDLASFYTDKEAWIADAGKYTIKAAASSEDIRLTGDFNLPKEIVVEKVNKSLVPKAGIREITK